MPTAALRQECRAYLIYQLETAKTLGLDHTACLSAPMQSNRFSACQVSWYVAESKRRAYGSSLPALSDAPSRQEAPRVLSLSLARQREVTSQVIS